MAEENENAEDNEEPEAGEGDGEAKNGENGDAEFVNGGALPKVEEEN